MSTLCDSIARYPNRFTAVGSVDVLQPDAPKMIHHWVERGTNGFRLFTGGSTAAFHPSTLDDPRSFPSWQLLGELHLSMCIQTSTQTFFPRLIEVSAQVLYPALA